MRKLLIVASVVALGPAVAACGGGDGGSAEAWCDLAREVEDAPDPFGGDETPSPETMKAAFTDLLDVFERAEKAAPDEIKDDVTTSLNAFREFNDALAAADYNFLDIDLSSIQQVMNDAEAAGDRIEAYNARECGIEPSTSDSVADDSSDGTLPQGSVRDLIMQQFIELGLTEEQATCVADNVDETAFGGDEIDPSQMMDLFSQCGVDPTQLGGGS
jgi:hypothetical protein